MTDKQTAVEWFYQRILSKDIKVVFELAKEMEKEQIIDAYLKNIEKVTIDKVLVHLDKAEEYYETIKTRKNDSKTTI